jgi:acetyltransferase-like isoleucine patch superfamily enzyme
MTKLAAEKRSLSRSRKLGLLARAFFDPRYWAHLIRRQGFYYYNHIDQIRKIDLGPGSHISPFAVFSNAERISIGRNARIGDRCYLWAGHGEARIDIGDDAMFGPDVMIFASRYRYEDGQPVHSQLMKEDRVVIGDDVWIGARVVVLPGATIGSGSVIGVGAVVQGTIPPMSVALGAPARVVMKREIASVPPAGAGEG